MKFKLNVCWQISSTKEASYSSYFRGTWDISCDNTKSVLILSLWLCQLLSLSFWAPKRCTNILWDICGQEKNWTVNQYNCKKTYYQLLMTLKESLTKKLYEVERIRFPQFQSSFNLIQIIKMPYKSVLPQLSIFRVVTYSCFWKRCSILIWLTWGCNKIIPFIKRRRTVKNQSLWCK